MRAIIGRDGRLLPDAPADVDQAAYATIAGLTVKQAQTAVVKQLTESGALLGEPRPIQHPVKFYERGERPLEIVTSRQWYIRNGGRDAELRAALVARAGELTWHPTHMRHRYENWVEGLNGDWLVSRQRFFGVPVPVWYPLDASGEPVYDEPLLPEESRLPIDPSTDVPIGYDASQRDQPGGFTGDPDVFDTWATSSLTPEIAGCWEEESDLFERIFPMDMRPQAHDIIRTWLFSTMVRSHHEFGVAPWRNAALSGWILDPDRKKMSKSKGNVVTPLGLFDTYGTDAVRYWAGSGRAGVDTALSEDQMKVGRKLATKLLNVTKFVLGFGDGADDVAGDLRPLTWPALIWPEGSPTRSTGRCWPSSTPRSPRRPRASRRSTTPAPSSAPRRSSGGSATTTSNSSRDAPTTPRATSRPHRPASRCTRRSARSNGCWHRSSRSPRRSRGVGGTREASTVPHGRCRPRWAATPSSSIRSSRCSRWCAGRRPRRSRASARRWNR